MKRAVSFKWAILLAGVVLSADSEARANVIVNGDFETASFGGWTVGSTQSSPFQAALNDGMNAQIVNSIFGQPAWFLRNVQANYFGTGNIATPISNYSAFNGFDGSPGYFFLQQGFTTTALLSSADLTFDYAVQSSYSDLPRVFTVNLLDSGGTPVWPSLLTYTRPTGYLPAWSPSTVSLDIASILNSLGPGNYQIQFRIDIPQNYTGPAQFAIDNISLDIVSTPEPTTLALLGVCAVGAVLPIVRRRQHRGSRANALPGS